uniref:Uncharacterized protein n=1 Tax=Arundo donax TaxID=35708 RepID=A0A0A9EE50_ARUDO
MVTRRAKMAEGVSLQVFLSRRKRQRRQLTQSSMGCHSCGGTQLRSHVH